MRLNRKWLYLGGLVTIMTLLLTLTWALPAGAVDHLNNGSLATDVDYVSPDTTNLDADDRMIEVTLTNETLDNTLTVEEDGDFGAVSIEVIQDISARTTGEITVEIDSGVDQSPIRVDLPEGITLANVSAILPITGALVVDSDETTNVVENAVGTPRIINAVKGLIRIPVTDDLEDGDTIVLSYETSPQETALANVGGDSDDFDVLAVEKVGGPADYIADFEVADQVTIRMHSDVGGSASTIVHEQHSVPSGLQGNLVVEDEEISNRYSDADLTMLIEDDTNTTEVNEADLDAGKSFYVQVANPPLRDRDGEGGGGLAESLSDVDVRDPDFEVTEITNAVQGIVQLTVLSGRMLEEDETVEIDEYRGSDSFYIEVNHGPIQRMTAPIDGAALNPIIVVPSSTDAPANSGDVLALISIGKGVDSICDDCRVRLGVVTGDTQRAEDDEDAVDLSGRISVLGISYQGSERISISDGLEANATFQGTLDFDPINVAGTNVNDDGDHIIDRQDIEVVGSSLASGDRITVESVDGRIVTFQLAALTGETDGDTVDVAYAIHAGGDPRNALLPDAEGRPIIAVSAGSRVTITSGNDRATVDAEVDAPTFSSPSPAHRGATDDDDQLISVNITDDLAGVDEKSVKLSVTVRNAVYSVPNSDLDFEDIDGGVRVSIFLDDVEDDNGRSPRIDPDEETQIKWYVTAADDAGNSTRSDAVADVDGESDTQGKQDYTFKVDGESAGLNRAYTGDWFDTVDERVEGDRRLGVENYLPGTSRDTSVRAVFNESLDCTTVSADDFTVGGTEPTAAECYSEGKTGGDDDDIAQSVFLTVPAMASDATPVVELVGAVSDKAGNSTSSGTQTASDGIAPSPTLSVNKTLSDKKVTVTVSTDERIRTLSPTLNLYVSDALDSGITALDETDTFTVGYEDEDDDTSQLVLRDSDGNGVASGGELEEDQEISLTLSKAPILDRNTGGVTHADVSIPAAAPVEVIAETSTNDTVNAKTGQVKISVERDLANGDEFTVTYRGTDPDPARGLTGVPNPTGKQVSTTSWTFDLSVTRNDRFAATATVEDRNRNRGTGGIGDPTHADATVFEIDNQLAGGKSAETMPQHDAAGNLPVSITDPFVIELSWDDEKNEYPGDSSSAVTLTKAELDGTDVLDTQAAQNDRSYRLSILDIGLGDHVLRYNAEDALGNTNAVDRVLRFTVQAVPTWDLELSAGMNLISLPADPASTSVNDLFGDTEQIELVFTFDGGQSLVALRNADVPGAFVGTLDRIDSQHAYWISSSNAATVEINIPPTSQLAPPPYIAVTGGQWNLLPVISLEPVDAGAAPGTEIDADAYLGDFRTAFGWNGRSWSKIDPDPAGEDRLTTGATVKVGMGYWVLYDEDAIITP